LDGDDLQSNYRMQWDRKKRHRFATPLPATSDTHVRMKGIIK
jgi:hypothetical protein